VIEASERSGALWTADFAKKHDKQIYAVPHPISSFEGKGCNLLLSKGAKPYLGWQSLTSQLDRCENNSTSIPAKVLDPILEVITNSPTSISNLSRELNMSETMIMDKLLSLELQGKLVIRGNMVSAR
jgi:DNA processing protein